MIDDETDASNRRFVAWFECAASMEKRDPDIATTSRELSPQRLQVSPSPKLEILARREFCVSAGIGRGDEPLSAMPPDATFVTRGPTRSPPGYGAVAGPKVYVATVDAGRFTTHTPVFVRRGNAVAARFVDAFVITASVATRAGPGTATPKPAGAVDSFQVTTVHCWPCANAITCTPTGETDTS
jgi:hypothetical protein